MAALTHPEAQLPVEPIPRGFSGHFFYRLGMALTRIFVRFQVEGQENIPQDLPYIVVANHETYVDGMWIASTLPRPHFDRFCALVGADLMTEHGVFGRIICHVGHGIPVNRKANPVRGLILAKKQVDAGNILLIHPEGTRSPDGRLGVLQDGASFLARKAGVPILPVYIDGGYQIFSRHMKWPKPFQKGHFLKRKKLILRIGPAIDPKAYAGNHEITEAIRQWMMEQQAHREVRDS